MYKVLCDGALMCDSRIEELALTNPVVKLEENKAGSFSFIISPQHPFYDSIQRRKTIIEVYRDDETEPTFSGICTEAEGDFLKQKRIICEGDMTFFNDSIQRPAQYKGYTVRGLLEKYIENHNAQVEEDKHFRVGIVTVTDPNDYITCYTNMESTMKCLKEDLVDDLGGIIRIRHENGIRYIDYLKESPNTNSQIIKFGKNLLDFTSSFTTSDIATAVIPLGVKLEESAVEGLDTRLTISSVNNGIDYVHSVDAVAAYGWIYKTIEFDDVTTPEALKRKGEQYLSETQFEDMVINAKAIDLQITDKEIEAFKISDQIRVVSAPHGLNKYFRLTKQTLNLNNPEKDTITLGKNEKLSLSAKAIQISSEIRKAVESIVPPSTILNQAIANATALITSAMGGYVVKTNNELLIMDTDNIETATKVWRWNINGLGYSSNGYKGPYALAMTMDGQIVGDRIAANSISSTQLAVKYVEEGKVSSEISAEKDGISIKGNRIEIESDNFTLTKDGTVKATGEFTTTKDTETGFISRSKMVGTGVAVYKHANTENDSQEVLCASLTGIQGEKSGSLTLQKNGIRDVAVAAGDGRGLQIFYQQSGSDTQEIVATIYRKKTWGNGEIQLLNPGAVPGKELFFYVGVQNANYVMQFDNWIFNTDRLYVDNNLILQNINGDRVGYFDRLNVGGSTMTSLAWQWSNELGCFVLTGTQ